MTSIDDEVIKNRRKINNVSSQTDTAISNDKIESLDYIKNEFTLNSDSEIIENTSIETISASGEFTLESNTTIQEQA